jgi:uncharacterized phage protein (TIGR02220 family)
MASVRIEDEAFADVRVELLGTVAGYNRFEALGRLAHLWRLCTQRETHVVSEAIVVATLGERGVEALLASELGERVLTPGEPSDSQMAIRVRGTAGRIEWLSALRSASKAGGEANRRRLASLRLPSGSAVDSHLASRTDSQSEARAKPELSPLSLTLTPTLKHKDSDTHDACPVHVLKPRRKAKPKPNEPTAAELASAKLVLSKLSARNAVQYTGCPDHVRLITTQLRNGVSEMDLRKIIGYCAEYLQWQTSPEMAHCLRPETLFGPRTISKYLDPARTWAAERKDQISLPANGVP